MSGLMVTLLIGSWYAQGYLREASLVPRCSFSLLMPCLGLSFNPVHSSLQMIQKSLTLFAHQQTALLGKQILTLSLNGSVTPSCLLIARSVTPFVLTD